MKLANPKLKVIAMGGDGDGYSEGTNHFVHAARSNINVTYIVHDNQIYGLTKGQCSPTSDKGMITVTSPNGVVQRAINPLQLAIVNGASFVARGFAGDVLGLVELMKKAITHKGFALLDVLQPCVTFNKLNTYDWYKKRVYYIKKPLSTRIAAIKKAGEWGKKIPLGVFFEAREDTYDESLTKNRSIALEDYSRVDIKPLLESLI